jgi:mycothiol synthase
MTTTVVLPGYHTVRSPEPQDAEAIFGLLAGYNTAVVGFADCTLDEVAGEIVDPGFDRGTDGWLVFDRDGLPAGYAYTFGKGNREIVEIGVTSQNPAVAAWLLDQTMQRAREMGRDGGHAEITVDSTIYRADEPLRALLSGHDFVVGTTYNQMRIDHTEPVATPEVPAGVVVRRGTFDEASRLIAHEVMIDSFRGQFGFVPRAHDDWVAVLDARANFDWFQLTLLEIDGQAVAIRMCSDAHLEEENLGHVGMLGVLKEFRGRGLARFLLRDAFALDAAAGRTGTTLYVDTNNPTPALGLYLSAGMTPTLVLDGWRRNVLPTN